jgi:DNA sulfur modification protein DndD
MRLEFIRLQNFRQFMGQQDADFSNQDDLNVTVFHGMNGAGKTSLFSAINWCLYEAGVEDIGEIISKPALMEAVEGGTVTMGVAVGFMHQAKRFIAKRTQDVIKSDHAYSTDTKFSLVQIKPSGDSETIRNPIGYMNSILPDNVRPYFFFDGEKMDDLTRADNKEVENAIRNIMRLPALERGEAHLTSIAAEFRRTIKKQGSSEVTRLTFKEDELREQKDKAIIRRDELKEEIRLARQHVADIEAMLRERESARELQYRRDNIQSRLTELEQRKQAKVLQIQQLANISYVNFLSEHALTALGILDEKRERGEIPSGIREQLVKDLLEEMVCICGRPFDEDDETHKKLYSLLRQTASGKLEEEVLGLGGKINGLSMAAATETKALNNVMQDHTQMEASTKQLYAELDDIKRQLKEMPEGEIAELERQRAKFERDRDMCLSEHGTVEGTVSEIIRQIGETVENKRAAEAKEKKLGLLSRKESLAQKAADAITQIKSEFSEHTRREIEIATKEIFSRLAWKQEHFQDIQLHSDFHLEVIDRWGLPTRQELSAGERQILSLSFISAMSAVSGEDAPLVMDTPFGRLSGDHLAAAAENLPNLTSQLILFVTDREWDEASRTGLEPRTGIQYELQFNENTGCTQIVEVDW